MRRDLTGVLTATVVTGLFALLSGGVAVAATQGLRRAPVSNPDIEAPPAAKPATTNANPVPTYRPQPQGTIYVPITPCRLVDTAGHGGPIAKGHSRSFAIRGSSGFSGQGGSATGCGIPSTATAVAASITTQDQSHRGRLRVWPAGLPVPTALTASFIKDTLTTTGSTLTLNAAGPPDITVRAYGGKTNVIIDVTGYYESQIHLIVLADGTPWYGTEQVSKIIHTSGTASYTLVFNRSLAGCNVLTTGNGQANVLVSGSWGASSLSVVTQLASGSPLTLENHDESFQVFVTC